MVTISRGGGRWPDGHRVRLEGPGQVRTALPIVLAAISASGCWVAYRPTAPRAASTNEIKADVVSVDTLGSALSVNVLLDLPPQHRAADAWLTSPATRPCQDGVPARAHAPGALRLRERDFEFDVDAVTGAGLLTSEPMVLDLMVLPAALSGARQCLRVPITTGNGREEWRAFPGWFLAMGLRHLATPSRASTIESGTLISLGAGAFIGPLRLRVDWLFGEAGTNRPPPAGYQSMTAQLLGAGVAVEVFPLRFGAWGLGFQVGGEYLATDYHASESGDSHDTYVFHGPFGPRAGLRLARLPWPRSWSGFRARPDSWSMGIDLFVSRWFGLDGVAPIHYGFAVGGEWGRWW
jgi:hypothetical protein